MLFETVFAMGPATGLTSFPPRSRTLLHYVASLPRNRVRSRCTICEPYGPATTVSHHYLHTWYVVLKLQQKQRSNPYMFHAEPASLGGNVSIALSVVGLDPLARWVLHVNNARLGPTINVSTPCNSRSETIFRPCRKLITQ